MVVMVVIFIALTFITTLQAADLKRGALCKTPNGETARCIALNSCSVILNAILLQNATLIKFAQDSQCGYDNDPLVCCGTVPFKSPRGSACLTPNEENATCVPVSKCPVIDKATKSNDRVENDFAKNSQCGYDIEPLTCCGTTSLPFSDRLTVHPLLPDRKVCGFEKATDRVFGGNITDKDELPWLALVRYKNNDGSDAGFKCGGTLINHNYVLTAAHCIIIDITAGFDVDSVRLGEWRISTERDCEEDLANPECNDPVVDVKVQEPIPHKDYDKRTGKHDIALLRLQRNVKFTDYIKPVCIPNSKLPESPPGTLLLIAGWGATENSSNSDYKLKARVPVVPRDTCAARIRQRGPITDVQVCAGGVDGKDTCQGDSGGPLLAQFPEIVNGKKQFYLEGVVAWGIGCGVKGFPAVYTRVSKYTTWITDTIKP